MEVVVTGSMGDYDAAMQGQLRAHVAAAATVDVSDVLLTLSAARRAASLLLLFRIRAHESEAADIAEALTVSLGSVAAATEALGIVVELFFLQLWLTFQ